VAKTKFLSLKSDVDVELCLHTIPLYPDLDEVAAHLKDFHGLTTTATQLGNLRHQFPEESQKARDKMAERQERGLISDLDDEAALATRIIEEGLKQVQRRLEAGTVQEPWRVVRDIADARSKAIDKSRLLQDKPTVIVDKASTNERWRLLQEANRAEAQEAVGDAEVVEDEHVPPHELPRATA
jgi:hypothetical protein